MAEDYGLGYGHAMAIYGTLKSVNEPSITFDKQIDKLFSGGSKVWRSSYDRIVKEIKKFGPDVNIKATNSYVSLLRSESKFGIVQVNSKRLDVGIKLKGMDPDKRLTLAGDWNTMLTHKVSIHSAEQLDSELLGWLHKAYDKATQ